MQVVHNSITILKKFNETSICCWTWCHLRWQHQTKVRMRDGVIWRPGERSQSTVPTSRIFWLRTSWITGLLLVALDKDQCKPSSNISLNGANWIRVFLSKAKAASAFSRSMILFRALSASVSARRPLMITKSKCNGVFQEDLTSWSTQTKTLVICATSTMTTKRNSSSRKRLTTTEIWIWPRYMGVLYCKFWLLKGSDQSVKEKWLKRKRMSFNRFAWVIVRNTLNLDSDFMLYLLTKSAFYQTNLSILTFKHFS